VTKGSFYWHFPSRERCWSRRWSVGRRWRQDLLFGELEPINDRARACAPSSTWSRTNTSRTSLYSELIKAMDHPAVQPVIGRVSERRLDYLTASFRQAGLSRTDARHRAQLAVLRLCRILQLNLQLHQTRMQHDEFEAYVEHMAATLIPNP
jgi:AcrR family transcriptional regulator